MSGIVGTSHSKSKIVGSSIDTAKAFCQFDASGTSDSGPYAGSFNVSSTISYVSAGRWTINFINPFTTNRYVAHITCVDAGGRNTTFYSTGTYTTSSCQIFITNTSQTGTTSPVVCFTAHHGI